MSEPLTTEQAARCDALAKRIAELDPNWPQPGMAADMGGYSLRCVHRLAGDLAWVGGEPTVREFHCPDDTVEVATPVFDCPSVCVPDWRDPATLGAILLSMRWHELAFDGDGWQCGDATVAPSCWLVLSGATRAEAILAAKLAQLEATNDK